jgi:large subunit GTPase 1
MPSNQGTSRKGKPKKFERAAGMGRALQKAQHKPHISKPSKNGMAMTPGVTSLNMQSSETTAMIEARASVLEINDLDDFLLQAEMANREFASEKEQLVVLDASTTAAPSNGEFHRPTTANTITTTTIKWSDQPESLTSQFAFQELSVPRRPKWTKSTTPQELEHMEVESFLEWRRSIAKKEELIALYQQQQQQRNGTTTELQNSTLFSSLGVTPFEKNLEIWRQLWRVMERCSVIVQIVDARNPLFYLSQDLKQYATVELGKPMVLLINKSDYLTAAQRREWHDYLTASSAENQGKGGGQWHHIFFSAHEQQLKLDQDAQAAAKAAAEAELRAPFVDIPADDDEDSDDDDDDDDDDSDDEEEKETKANNEKEGVAPPSEAAAAVQHKEEDQLDQQQQQAASKKVLLDNVGIEQALTREELLNWLHTFALQHNSAHDSHHTDRIPFGMVGFPNVGKSSVINVLMGNTRHAHGVVRVAVAAQPGKTKHFQTLLLPERDDVLLCDCPGLVFPSFVSNTADLIAAGVYPIAQMRDHSTVMGLVCQRIPRQVLNARYGIQIPLPGPDRILAFEQQRKQQQQQQQKQQQQQQNHQLLERNNSAHLLAASESLPPPTGDEFLNTYCAARSIADVPRAARLIIKDYAAGKLLYCHAPPTLPAEQVQDFYKETLITAMNLTKKLHDKLKQQSQPGVGVTDAMEEEEERNEVEDEDDGSEAGDEDEDENNDETDDFMLELLDEVSSTTGSNNKSSSSKAKIKPTKKWGKKGKKFRNSDPYGCHSTSEEILNSAALGNAASLKGISVKAGKYGSNGYTRPQGYGGARSAAL